MITSSILFLFSSLVFYKMRAPTVLDFILPKENFVAGVSVSEQEQDVRLVSNNFQKNQFLETLPRYQLKVIDFNFTPKHSQYAIQVSHLGSPNYFLEKSDFNLYFDDQIIQNWMFELLPPDSKLITDQDKKQSYYLLSIPKGNKFPKFSVHQSETKNQYQINESIHFSLDEYSVPATEVEVFVDGISQMKMSPPPYKRFFEFPLKNYSPGVHQIKINITGSNNAQSTVEFEIKINPIKSFSLLQPGDNEVVGDSFDLLVQLPDSYPVYQTRLVVKISGDSKKIIERPPYETNIDISYLDNGVHSVSILVEAYENNQWVEKEKKQVNIVKSLTVPQIVFDTPTIEEFLNLRAKFSIQVSDENFNYVELYLGQQKIHSWDYPPYTTELDTDYFNSEQQIFTAKAYNSQGLMISTSTRTNLGRGRLQISLQEDRKVTNNVFNKKIIFILDGSRSMSDLWDGQSKWFWSNVIFSLPELAQALEKMQVGILTAGVENPAEFNYCEDKKWISEDFNFDSNKILAKTNQLEPRGIFGLYNAVDHVMQLSPEVIVVIADGLDSCQSGMPEGLQKKLQKRKTDLKLILLDPISDKYQQEILALRKNPVTEVSLVKNGEELKRAVTDLLAINYELYLGNKKFFTAPVNNQEQLIRSGQYRIKIPLYPELNLPSLQVYNGLTSRFYLKEVNQRLTLEEAK